MELEKRIIDDCAYIRSATFPRHIDAVTLPNADGTFDIYVNSVLSPQKQIAALKHELNHIERDHFYKNDGIKLIEAEADLAFVM